MSKMLAMKGRVPGFIPQQPYKKLYMCVCAHNPSPGEVETGSSQGLADLLVPLMASFRFVKRH